MVSVMATPAFPDWLAADWMQLLLVSLDDSWGSTAEQTFPGTSHALVHGCTRYTYHDLLFFSWIFRHPCLVFFESVFLEMLTIFLLPHL